MLRVAVTIAMIFTLVFGNDLPDEQGTESNERQLGKELEARIEQSPTGHSRQKRGYGALFRGTLTGLSWGAYGLSVGSTIYHAIRKCKDYRPKSCQPYTCQWATPCWSACTGPDTNQRYVATEKEKLKKRLDLVDNMLLHAHNLEVEANSAIIDSKRIVSLMQKINGDIDGMMFDLAGLDPEISKKFMNKSKEIKAIIQNHKNSLNAVITSPAMQGIFDKWTWGGTGQFVFSAAFTVSVTLYQHLKQRYAIHMLYKDMKKDFSRRFINQKSVRNPLMLKQPKLHNKFAYVQGYSSKVIDAQIKKTARSVYNSKQAASTQAKLNKIVGPLIDTVSTALSVWSIYKHIANCQKIADDMRDTANEMTKQRDEIEKIMKTKVEKLQNQVITQAWGPVKDFLRNETTHDWLESIRNLTLEANNTRRTDADTIRHFLQNIVHADIPTTIALQKKLITALNNIELRFYCLARKQHAITVVIRKCQSGLNDSTSLYAEANSQHGLNNQECINSKMVPHTSQEQLHGVINETAEEKGWYSNCLLNNKDLLIRVCSEKRNGYSTPAEIIKQIKNYGSVLTEFMVTNFLTRCPPPKITPQNKLDTCKLHCLYQTPQEIATIVDLRESQVNEIIKTCSICPLRAGAETEICALHFCKGENASFIEKKVRLPLLTVNFVISKRCAQKCIADDTQKKEICKQFKCKSFDAIKIVSQLQLPLTTINEVTPNCDIILPNCGPVSDEDKRKILFLHCSSDVKASAAMIHYYKVVQLSLSRIQSVINSQKCEDFKTNGLT